MSARGPTKCRPREMPNAAQGRLARNSKSLAGRNKNRLRLLLKEKHDMICIAVCSGRHGCTAKQIVTGTLMKTATTIAVIALALVGPAAAGQSAPFDLSCSSPQTADIKIDRIVIDFVAQSVTMWRATREPYITFSNQKYNEPTGDDTVQIWVGNSRPGPAIYANAKRFGVPHSIAFYPSDGLLIWSYLDMKGATSREYKCSVQK